MENGFYDVVCTANSRHLLGFFDQKRSKMKQVRVKDKSLPQFYCYGLVIEALKL